MSVATVNQADMKLSITRVFDASPERVFNAWLDPEQMAKWMGPRAVIARSDVAADRRVGGQYRIQMVKLESPEKSPDSVVTGTYKEITPHSRLIFTWSWEKDSNCNNADSTAAPQAHEEPCETIVTVTFKPVGQKTEMTLLHEHFPNIQRRDSHNYGWSASVDQLGALLNHLGK